MIIGKETWWLHYVCVFKELSPRTIYQSQYLCWPDHSCPSEASSIMDLVELVEKAQRQTNNGPITVHCRYMNICKGLIASYVYNTGTLVKVALNRTITLSMLTNTCFCLHGVIQLASLLEAGDPVGVKQYL